MLLDRGNWPSVSGLSLETGNIFCMRKEKQSGTRDDVCRTRECINVPVMMTTLPSARGPLDLPATLLMGGRPVDEV